MEVECLALKDLTSPRKSFTVEEDGSQSEQKENMCAAVPVLLLNRRGVAPERVHMTPIKPAGGLSSSSSSSSSSSEPWTPTANLKMLISAASPDIRDREMKKVLFRPIENEKDPAAGTAAAASPPGSAALLLDESTTCQFEAAEEEDDGDKKPSRKQKSLGLLCQKFLALYPDYPPPHCPIWISLDEVATSLGVERRRIYDIVNVLESLQMVGRMAKNSYSWFGRQRLGATLEELQRRGRQQGYHLHMEAPARAREAGPGREDDGDAANGGGNRKDKSLRIMSQKFVMLFLVSRTQTVTLDAAAKILIEEGQDSSSHSKYKTKVRRLYDIANVLTSLSLIKKVHVREERGRKPAFKWLGPVDFRHCATSGSTVNVGAVAPPEATTQQPIKAKMARHASFNVAPTPVSSTQRHVSSAPSSPRRENTRLTNEPMDYSKRATSNSAVCRLQFGDSTDIRPQPVHPSPGCLAYLPSLSQPSVVMLYRAPEGQRAPGKRGRDQRGEEEEEEDHDGETVARKKGTGSGLEHSDKMRADGHREEGPQTSPGRPAGLVCRESESAQPSHYLYVPNNAGLNGLNFLLSAGQSPGGLALPAGGAGVVPTLAALPYVLVPSSALSHYALQQQQPQQVLSCPAAHFMVSGVGVGPEVGVGGGSPGGSGGPSPSTPEQSRLYWASTPRSSPPTATGPRHTLSSINTPEAMTPNQTTASASKAFFQTPGTLGNVVSAVPAARKRGSVQRRLDVGHPPAS